MIAEIGKIYAQIQDGKCKWVFTHKELREWDNEGCPAVEVVGRIPVPGDIWNGTGFDPAPVDTTVYYKPLSRWQMRKALKAAGLLSTVKNYVKNADEDTQDAWECASEFRRDHALVNAVATALGKTEAELDAVFVNGATL